ncbi:hypothetical protein [Rhodococcus sp. NPDC060176]|uniref:hypothetical protein n=1 Tax=Rhodococcus sp. NPDC060176 TaxID=3347062 RepID=UPI0036588652
MDPRTNEQRMLDAEHFRAFDALMQFLTDRKRPDDFSENTWTLRKLAENYIDILADARQSDPTITAVEGVASLLRETQR